MTKAMRPSVINDWSLTLLTQGAGFSIYIKGVYTLES